MNNDTDMGNEKKKGACKVLLFIPDWDMKRKWGKRLLKKKFQTVKQF